MSKFIAVVLAGALSVGASLAFAAEAESRTVEAVYKDKAALVGKEVSVKGKVVKVNNGIMGRNFVHVQDGTGDQNSNNLIITSTQTAGVGDSVQVTGKVVLDRKFGAGYSYPLLLEEGSITASQAVSRAISIFMGRSFPVGVQACRFIATTMPAAATSCQRQSALDAGERCVPGWSRHVVCFKFNFFYPLRSCIS